MLVTVESLRIQFKAKLNWVIAYWAKCLDVYKCKGIKLKGVNGRWSFVCQCIYNTIYQDPAGKQLNVNINEVLQKTLLVIWTKALERDLDKMPKVPVMEYNPNVGPIPEGDLQRYASIQGKE